METVNRLDVSVTRLPGGLGTGATLQAVLGIRDITYPQARDLQP
jgi:hypothetical protein